MKISKQIAKLIRLVQGESIGSQRSRHCQVRKLLIEQLEYRRLLATIDLAALTAAQGTIIFGADASDYSGLSVSSAGDVNGDGFDDLLIGASDADAAGNAKPNAGETYLIFGATALPATIDLASLGSTGITIFGSDAGDRSGRSVSSAGDVNGDGFDDVLIGAYRAYASGNAKSRAGESYVIFGGPSLPATIDLVSPGSAGVTIFGADAVDKSGNSVSSAGDVNGDGFDDLIIGAIYADALGNAKTNAGDSYLIFGGNSFTNSILPANLGTNAANTITGTAGPEILNGADGDDTLVGGGGADILLGGRGNDILAVTDLNFNRIVGGNGTDTLRIDGSVLLLNLTTIGDNRIVDIETIDITGSGNNTLNLNQREVLNLSSSSNTLIVRRNLGDTVNMSSGWTQGANETIGPDTFDVFTQGQAVLKLQQTTSFSIIIDLAALVAGQGTTIFGAEVADVSGFSVSGAGDVNGDGFDDLLIGAYQNIFGAGESYLIYGAGSLPATIDLANLGSAGVTIFGAFPGDQSGNSVSSAGDVNGDGFDDLIIGASNSDGAGQPNSGSSYVIFGIASLPATIDLANLGSLGITIFNVGATSNDNSGFSVSSAGDVNGDGFDDLLIGAPYADLGDVMPFAGESYVIFGAVSLPATIDLANLGSGGTTIFGADVFDTSGFSVGSAGDVNGDGFDDLLIGSRQADASEDAKSYAGDSYVILGSASLPATIDLANVGSAGITIFGADANDESGFAVSGAGDVNGDGFDDLLIGASHGDASDNAKSDAGESYLVFGAASLPATIDLANLAAAGITIFGVDPNDRSGFSVSSAGDVNGDGFDDLLIGAPYAYAADNIKSRAGESYVIFGAASIPATIDLANPSSTLVTIFGANETDSNGRSVSSAGDVNGDGFDDLLIGAPYAAVFGTSGYNVGESYVIYGGNDFTNSIHPANLGTNDANTITGTPGAEILNGADGNDTLVGNGGADILLGGRGNDILAVSELNFKRIVGGNGTDTIRLDGSGQHLNLTTFGDNRIVDIETIDITGSGNNTLTLNQREVLNLSSSSNTLLVRRNYGDTINMGSGWTQGASETIGPDTFDVFAQGRAVLKVRQVNSIIAARHIFFNNATGANLSSAGAAANAIASDKSPLLPGNASTFANYTNYSRGLNGIIVDIQKLPAATTDSQILASLQFAHWNGISAGGFTSLPGAAIPAATILSSSGVGGSARVKITFPDNTLQNTWLRVTVLANADTALAANDVFYFGNVMGELDFGNTATRLRVNGQDAALLLANQSPGANSAIVTNKFDLDRNGRVNGQDYAFLLANQQAAGIVAPITAPSARSTSAARSSSDSNSYGAVPFELPLCLKKDRRGDSNWDSVDAYFASLWNRF